MNKFWIVVREHHQLQATYRHPSLESARKEAERLAGEHKGKFFVFELVGSAEFITPVQWLSLDDARDKQLPF